MFQKFIRRSRREEGQAALEMVLMLPFFFTFFLFLIDLGIMMYGYVSIANAAREGARFGAVNCGDGACDVADVQGRAMDRSGNWISDLTDVDVSWPDGIDRGDPVAVHIIHTHELVFFPFDIDIESCASMRLEQQDSGASAGGTDC